VLPKFSYQWPERTGADKSLTSKYEALSYEPLLKYLKANNMNAFIFPNEEKLSNSLLFDIHIHSLKSTITLTSKYIRQHAGEVPSRSFISLAVLTL